MSSNGDLTPRQQRAIACLLSSPTIEAASKKAGVSRSTLYEWLKIPAFQEELEWTKRSQFQAAVGQLRSLVPEAIQGLKDLAQSSNEQIRLRACVEILKAATNAYGSQAPLPFTLGGSALEVSTDQKGKLDLSGLSEEELDLAEKIGLMKSLNRA
jgi:transposase-like protein